MDLSNIQKYVDNELSRFKISRDVTETKNLVKDRLAGTDTERSAFFTTLRDPIIKQQQEQIKNKMR